MKKNISGKILLCLVILSLVTPIFGQRGQKKIIFAVLNDGKALEPIVEVEGGKLVEIQSSEQNGWKDFTKQFYKPKTSYNLIFGGAMNGKTMVVSSAPESDCAANMATVTTVSPKAKLGGMVMALATDAATKKGFAGTRRAPTAAERGEIEKLVREEMSKNKISAANLKGLRSHNLTALDVDGDKSVEFVGSYWLPTTRTTRATLFFIAEKEAGKFKISLSEFNEFKQEEVMSGDIKDLDSGIYHKLLLDVFDVDADGTAEIFTIGQAFEGNNFYIFKREGGKWAQTKEIYNYHCGY